MGLLQIARATNSQQGLKNRATGTAIRSAQDGRLPGELSALTHGPLDTVPVAVLRAGHIGLGFLVSLVFALFATIDDRSWREILLVWLTALVGQLVTGWMNDLIDQRADRRNHRGRKPLATDTLDTDWMWFAFAVGCCLIVPAAMLSGVLAGLFYLGGVAVAILGTVLPFVRRTPASVLTWAASFGLFAFYLTLGGWGGRYRGDWPWWLVVVAAAIIGVGVHLMTSVRGLVADNRDGWTHLPLLLARRIGAFWVFVLGLAVIVAAVVVLGMAWGYHGLAA